MLIAPQFQALAGAHLPGVVQLDKTEVPQLQAGVDIFALVRALGVGLRQIRQCLGVSTKQEEMNRSRQVCSHALLHDIRLVRRSAARLPAARTRNSCHNEAS